MFKAKVKPRRALLILIKIKNYFFVKNDTTSTNTTIPTNPPSPKRLIRFVRLATTSIPNTAPPVNTYQTIDTGITAIKMANNPEKKLVTYLITESIILSFSFLFCGNIAY